MQQFVNLYQLSEYTMLGCTIKINQLTAQAKDSGYNALAITDLNNMHGAYKFYKTCLKAGLQPIIGLGVVCDSDDNFDNLLLLYAKSEIGYRNLLVIASWAKIKGSVDLDFFSQHNFDLLAIIPGEESAIIKLYKDNEPDRAGNLLDEYRNVFPDIYLGLDMQSEFSRNNIDSLIAFGRMRNIKAVALNKTLYLGTDDFAAYQVLKCIDLGINQYPFTEKETNSYFLTPDQANLKFKNYPELIAATTAIAEKCRLELKFTGYRLPVYPDAQGKSYSYLTELSKIGLNKRIKNRNIDFTLYKKRLLYELDIINKMGFCDYFLIVYDFVKYAKKNNILVGPGRGSAPGSLVSYALGITDVDPMAYDLLFERFLNPERITMPDIDIDFPDIKRDEVIRYVMSKYGANRVAHISTFGTFGVRLAIRDVARVRKFSDVELNEVLKYIPSSNMKIDNILAADEMFKSLVNANPKVGDLVAIVRKIEGLPRHISTHAAGIIMADEDLVNYTALQPGINGLYQTQYEADDLSEIGLVKFDFLGLKNLTIIEEVIAAVKRENPGFAITDIPLDDGPTYRMIAAGDTDGIFQLESAGMRNVLVGLKASRFTDIVYANALYRPGPMEMISNFIRRKFRQEKVDYIHPDLKEILAPTYGTIVFQEQIMMIARQFAGYTLGMADILRRAVSKKDKAVMMAERKRFVMKAQKKGYREDISNKVYDYIVRFADYGFNKSHSVAYSLIAYQMAYLKRRYYRYFMAVLMSHSIGSVDSIKDYVRDCRKKGINVYPPSINKSEKNFSVKDNGIYYSLLAIQNVGPISLNNLLAERNKNGLFRSYKDFLARTVNIINRRIVESLIWAGALDDFSLPHKQMADEYESTLDYVKYQNLFNNDELLKKKYGKEEYQYEELSLHEREVLGFNLKYSLFSRYQNIVVKDGLYNLSTLPVGANNKAMFALEAIKPIITKNNEEMAFLRIFDDFDQMDAVMFPHSYRLYKHLLAEGVIYVGRGKVKIRNNKKQYEISFLDIIDNEVMK